MKNVGITLGRVNDQKITFQPRKLYRFQPVCIPDDDRLSKLQSGEIWFSDPAKFNDPFDLNPNIKNLLPDRWCDAPEFRTAIRKALFCLLANPAMYQGALFLDPALVRDFQAWISDDFEDEFAWDLRLSNAIQTRISQFGMVCLTPQWDNRLMWAHYAKSGQGFCIEYEVDWGEQQTDFRYVPVQYASQVPEMCITEAMFTPHQFLYRVLATKHADWAYEQEVRLVCLTDKGKNVKVDPKFVRIKGLIAGFGMSEPVRAHLIQTAKRLNVEAWCVKTTPHGSILKDRLL